MPYIKVEDRAKFRQPLADIANVLKTEGEINYCITKICHDYLTDWGINYTNINRLIGVLECAKIELYRKIASPYEDRKEIENGSV